MKIFIAISLVFYFIAFAKAESCLDCLEDAGKCVGPCSAGLEDPLCWACVAYYCYECVPDCFVSLLLELAEAIK